jgi:hypothetical protein
MIGYSAITTDGQGRDLAIHAIEASGIGEAGQTAYRLAEEADRYCIAVVERADVALAVEALAHYRIVAGD